MASVILGMVSVILGVVSVILGMGAVIFFSIYADKALSGTC